MSDQSILLQLPPQLYARVRQIAQESNRPLESVLVDSLALLFGDQETLSPEQLTAFSDDQLWGVVHRPFAWVQDIRLRELTVLGKLGALTDDAHEEMEHLIEAVDHYVLLRSQALMLLKQRGYDVEKRLQQGAG
jgi:hypothetical protein